MEQSIQQLQDRIAKLEEFIFSLQADTTISLEVDRAFSSRLQIVKGSTSSKTAASATTVVSGKSVMLAPDGFVTITVNDTPRNIPYIN